MVAAPAANHWFGGALSALFGVMGEKFPEQMVYTRIMPGDRLAFAWSVFNNLGERRFRGSSEAVASDIASARAVYVVAIEAAKRAQRVSAPRSLFEEAT